ncbi:MAG: 4Fe-4S dicluster domain-containing protein [Desulfobacteraceae bacterium]|nr:4Fe-4S dicluster domain-containing protein [Desulfobacteraceae bacterium]
MIFEYTFYAACLVCVLGMIYKFRSWFSYRIGPPEPGYSAWQRIWHALRAVVRTVFSIRIFRLAFSLVYDVILQAHILRKDPLRWVMHFFIFAGFTALLLMHALEDPISRELFPAYHSTVNPFMFLRNLFGLLVLIGLGLAIYRRRASRTLRRITTRADRIAIALLLVIMASGFLLEGAKIISPSVFASMLRDYSGYAMASEDSDPIKTYWQAHYGVVFAGEDLPETPEMMEQGKFMHVNYCAYCHDRPEWAFVSYPVSRVMQPAAGLLDRVRMDVFLWYVHFLACFIGLALLPFTKFFHVITTPLSLLVNSAGPPTRGENADRLNRRAMELDACTSCGTCSLHCSVAPMFARIENRYILPSERLSVLKKIASGKPMTQGQLQQIVEGGQICTKCYRCTRLCPAGIDLQDIWLAAEEQLAQQGYSPAARWIPDSFVRDLPSAHQKLSSDADLLDGLAAVSVHQEDFSGCLKCKTCTNACPVVDAAEDPLGELDLLPHQMMHALSLGMWDTVLSSRMIWACATCYLCQEHCPQDVRITDIFYGLKNLAHRQANKYPPN